MDFPRTRRVERVHLPQPLVARLGSARVVLVDVSVLGARVEHHVPLTTGAISTLAFEWEGETIEVECRIIRSRLERFSVGPDGLTVYHSGVEYTQVAAWTAKQIKAMIALFISRALEEQKLNARGVLPQHDVTKMPIFRYGGQLTANMKDKEGAEGLLPTARVVRETGYVCYRLENNQWRPRRTHDPGQPPEGFTISALEDRTQIEMLCSAYEKSDREGRRLIQLFAQLSIVEGEGIAPGRFEP